MPGGQRYVALAAASRAKNASVALVKSVSVPSGNAVPGDLHEADRPGGLVDPADDLGPRRGVGVRHAEAGDVDHGHGEDAVAQGG